MCLPVVLSKLFKLILLCKQVPAGFGHSYIVPLPKLKDCITKVMSCEDFRGIAISAIISKVFEYCFIEKFSDNKQFGFKKGMGCSHAIYTVRRVVERFIKRGNTVNLCSVDLTSV